MLKASDSALKNLNILIERRDKLQLEYNNLCDNYDWTVDTEDTGIVYKMIESTTVEIKEIRKALRKTK
jgi:hypothetical protein